MGARATRQEATPVIAGFPERPVRPRSRQKDPEEEMWMACYGAIQQENTGGGDRR